MDLLNVERIFLSGREYNYIFYDDYLVWAKYKHDFNRDFKNLDENEDFYGIFDYEKGGIKI